MARKPKSKFMIWVEYIPFMLLYKFVRLLPLKVAYAISSVLIAGAYYLDARHRNRTINHMLHAGIVKERKEAVKMAKRCYHEFSMLLAEIFKMDQCYDKAKITVTGPPESVREYYKATSEFKTHILVVAHYGNWEVAGHAYCDLSGRTMASMMRPFDNPKIGDLILSHRASPLHQLIPKNLGLRQGLKALSERRVFTVLIDQHAAKIESVETIFFGHPCNTHKTPALMHLKTGYPLIPEVTRRLPGKDFRFEIVLGNLIKHEPTDDKERDIQTITQMCTTELERLIREQPEQWMWAARRWLDADGRRR